MVIGGPIESDGFRVDLMLHLYPVKHFDEDQSMLLNRAEVNGGIVEVWIQSGPRFLIRVAPPSAPPYHFRTRPLVFVNEHAFELALACDHEKALAWINGTPAGAKVYEIDDEAPLTVELPAWADTDISELVDWVNDQSALAVKNRAQLMATLQPKYGRRPIKATEMMNSLLNEHVQILDLLGAIQHGRESHAIGLAARLRSLMCHFKNNKLPLLQHCAAILDLPLPVYVPAPHWASYDREPGVEFGFRIFPAKVNSAHIEMDLDVWLSAPLCRFEDHVYTNNDMVRMLADTLGGAHYDKSVEPMADALEGWFTRSFGVQGILNGKCGIVVECAATAAKLCSDVLGACSGDIARLSERR